MARKKSPNYLLKAILLMANSILPVIFVVLWFSAFVAGNAGLHHATPFAFWQSGFRLLAVFSWLSPLDPWFG